jgi:YebC/PmpR family DNA-binding regulatory protein
MDFGDSVMSGHSKWSTIKRKKGAEDAKRGKIFTRVTREIVTAAREGGPDISTNSRLRLAIDKAKAANMPKDNIERAINKGAGIGGEADTHEEITYEGYAPHGIALIVDTVTDNRNRTLAEVKHVFSRAGGSLASSGAVQWQFSQRGYIEVLAEGVDFDMLFLSAADAGAEDVEANGETISVYTAREDLHAVESTLSEAGYRIEESKLIWSPHNEIELEPQQAVQIFKLIEKLEELDDVQTVASNLKVSDEAIAAFEQG